MLKKATFVTAVFLAVLFSKSYLVKAQTGNLDMSFETFCNAESCDVTVSVGYPSSYTGLLWRHKLDGGEITPWVADDDIYHIIIPRSEVGEHKVKVWVKNSNDNMVSSEKYAFIISPENFDLVFEPLYMHYGQWNLTVGAKENGNPATYYFKWRYKLDNGPVTEWVSDDDLYHILLPVTAVGPHTAIVQVNINGYLYVEAHDFVVPAQN